MRNLHKLLIVLISVVFITSGVIAQSVVDNPSLNNQVEKVKPEKPVSDYQTLDNPDAPGGTLEMDAEGNVLPKSTENINSSGNDISKFISPYGPNYNVKGTLLDCPAGSLFDQSVVGYTTGVTAEADPGYVVYQYYTGVSGTINTITFWGINAWFDGAGWAACEENPMEFNIGFYGDASGAPDPADELEYFTSTLDGEGTGELFAGAYEIMQYTFVVPGGVTYADAWIGIQGAGAADCWFLWCDSGTPGTLSFQDAGTGPAVTTYVQSLCLGGALAGDDIGISNILSPATGPDLGMEDVTVEIMNYGENAQSGFDVTYTIDAGATVTETVSATVNSGESIEYTFSAQADLSSYGTYEIVACTDLSGDENTANDCYTTSVQNYDPSSQCTFSVTLWDDYGDGWNGGLLTISVGGTVVLENLTIETGFGPESHTFDVINGAEVVCTYVGSGWPYENSYIVYDNDDNEVFADGLGGVEPVGGSFNAVCIQFVYGDLEGYVTENSSGNDLEGVEVMVDDMTTTTDATGYYSFVGVMIGTWDVYFNMAGYNPGMASGVVITEGNTTQQDFAMLAPTMDIDPMEVNIVIDPESTATETINIANNGDGSLYWSADLELLTESGSKVYGYTGLQKDVIGSEEAKNADVIAVGTPMAMEKIKNLNIPLTKYGTDDVDIIGGDVNGYNAGPRNRGNLFTCTESLNLVEFAGWHDVTSDPTQMWLLVYEGDSQEGVYNLVVASDITPAPIGLGWCSSGIVNYPLIAGKYYMMTASFEQACGYYNDQAVTPFPYPVAFGEATAGVGWNYAPAAVFPPAETENVAGQGTDPTLYYQSITTGAAGVVWLEIDPTEGTLEADTEENEDMTLSFSSVDIPAGTVKTAEITFISDPNVGTVTVPVSMTVGDQLFGFIEGNVELTGGAPYNWEMVENVLVEAGPYSAYPDVNGDYVIEAYPGTYEVTATLYGYESTPVPGIVITEGITVSDVDFTMPTINGMLMGYVTDEETGDPIENATITVIDTEFEMMTDVDGYYEFIFEAGTYDVMADHPTYIAQTAPGVVVEVETDTQQDFVMTFACAYCPADGGNDEFIDGIEFGDIVNLATGYNTGYEDFTNMSTVVIPGLTYTLTVHIGGVYATDDIGVWIDWNMDCVFDPATENAVCSFDEATAIMTFDVLIPASALSGNTVMRVRLKYSGADCGDPCGTTTWGEVEDYGLFVAEGVYGELEGYVTEVGSGDPIEGAEIDVAGSWTTYSGSDGYYYFEEVAAGTWEANCTAVGYNPADPVDVTIVEGELTEQDFELGAPDFSVDPLSFEVTLEPNETTTEVATLSNPGNGSIDWEAAVMFITDGAGNKVVYSGLQTDIIGSDEAKNADVIAYGTQVPVDQMTDMNVALQGTPDQILGSGNMPYPSYAPGATDEIDIVGGDVNGYNAGPRARGNFFECTTEKLLVEFMGWHDVSIDPTQMWMLVYEGATAEGTYNMVVSVDITPAPLGLGWVSSGPISYVLQEGMHYMILASFEQACGYYNDQAITPWPYPVAFGEANHAGAGWNYAPAATFPPPASYEVAGQGTDPVLYYQQLVTADGAAWLSIDPDEGTLGAGETADMDLMFDATDMLPGDYYAEIPFTTVPDVGSPVIEVTLHVEGLVPAINLEAGFDCVDVMLTWEMPAGGTPDEWNVYRDELEIGVATTMEYTDEMVDPEMEYTYTVTAVYAGEESQHSTPAMITVPIPEDLEAFDLEGTANGTTATLMWEAPVACLAPDSYTVYRGGDMIAEGVTATEYEDAGLPEGFYEYYVVAVYYFGESEASDPTYVLIVGIEDFEAGALQIFPNPASEVVNVKSPVEVSRIQVLNNNGQLVLDEEVNANEYQVNVSKYEAGIYFIKLETSEGIILRKVAVK